MKRLLAVSLAAALLLAAPQRGYASSSAEPGPPAALEQQAGQEPQSTAAIDDGAVPLANLPKERGIPLELMLMLGGLVFGGVSLYAYRSRAGRGKGG